MDRISVWISHCYADAWLSGFIVYIAAILSCWCTGKIYAISGGLFDCVVTGDDDLWGVDFNAQLVQRHVYFLERSPVLESLVGEKSMKMTDDGWVMVWILRDLWRHVLGVAAYWLCSSQPSNCCELFCKSERYVSVIMHRLLPLHSARNCS